MIVYPEVTPVINFNATRNENHAAAGGGPDGQGDGQHDQQQLLANNQADQDMSKTLSVNTDLDHANIVCRNNKISIIVHHVTWKSKRELQETLDNLILYTYLWLCNFSRL